MQNKHSKWVNRSFPDQYLREGKSKYHPCSSFPRPFHRIGSMEWYTNSASDNSLLNIQNSQLQSFKTLNLSDGSQKLFRTVWQTVQAQVKRLQFSSGIVVMLFFLSGRFLSMRFNCFLPVFDCNNLLSTPDCGTICILAQSNSVSFPARSGRPNSTKVTRNKTNVI